MHVCVKNVVCVISGVVYGCIVIAGRSLSKKKTYIMHECTN